MRSRIRAVNRHPAITRHRTASHLDWANKHLRACAAGACRICLDNATHKTVPWIFTCSIRRHASDPSCTATSEGQSNRACGLLVQPRRGTRNRRLFGPSSRGEKPRGAGLGKPARQACRARDTEHFHFYQGSFCKIGLTLPPATALPTLGVPSVPPTGVQTSPILRTGPSRGHHHRFRLLLQWFYWRHDQE